MLWRTSDGRFGGGSAAGTPMSDKTDNNDIIEMRHEALRHCMLQGVQMSAVISSSAAHRFPCEGRLWGH